MYILAKLFKALNSEAGPWQMAVAITLGMILGLTPLWRLHNLLVLLAVLLFRVNLASFLASAVMFSGLGALLGPAMAGLGEVLLTTDGLQGPWTALYNSGLGRLSQFNHTLTLGSLLLALLLAPLVLPLSRYLVLQYRGRVRAWAERLRITQALRATRFYQFYRGF